MLTKSDLETPRTAADMLPWVLSALDGFRATKELRAAAREGKFLAKELVDEALPIALFARRYYDGSSEVTITHVIGSQQYDAIVDDRRKKPARVRYVEATVSDWDYTESLRAEILNRDGHAPAYTDVLVQGPKGRRTTLRAKSMAVNHDDIREQHIAGVISAVKKKAARKYPDDTALVVRIDDAAPFREDADIRELDEVAQVTLAPLLSGREFRVLALEGSLRVHLFYEL
jgi:hypothetical protein